MQGSNCPKCGGPLPPGASFCSYCGASIPKVSAPLTSAPYPTSSYGPLSPPKYAPPPAAPRRSRLGSVVLVILVVIILVVAAIAVAYLLFPNPPIQIQSIYIWAPNNVCGLNANPISYDDGYNGSTGSAQTIDLAVPNYNQTACTINAVTTNSSGFSLSAVQVPLTIPVEVNASMNLTIASPSSAFTGNLNLVFS